MELMSVARLRMTFVTFGLLCKTWPWHMEVAVAHADRKHCLHILSLGFVSKR